MKTVPSFHPSCAVPRSSIRRDWFLGSRKEAVSMLFEGILARYAKSSPVSVLVRGTLETVFSQQSIDELFAATAERQYAGELMFSSVVELLNLTVCGMRKSVREAYMNQEERLNVSIKSVYTQQTGPD